MPQTPPAGRLARAALCGLVLAVAACSLPPEAFENTSRAPGVLAPTDSSVKTVQLFRTGEEESLPLLQLGGSETLTLAFDVLTAGQGVPLQVSFQHINREGMPDLLPTEYLTGFERDDITDFRPSGVTAIPYVHYRYAFPNGRVGFRISGAYRLTVSDVGGAVLFERTFYISEEQAQVDLSFGTTLAEGAVGLSIQPGARIVPRPSLQTFDAFQYTVCFARDGRLDTARCAPEPRLIDQALFQFFLPREQAFDPPRPRYKFDVGLLLPNQEVLDVDRTTRPPTVLLDLDYADFGGDVRDAVLAVPLVESAYRDAGDSRTQAEYADVIFRYVPDNSRQLARPVYVRGAFNNWEVSPETQMRWDPEGRRYEATVLVKQGRYTYDYVAPGGPPRRALALGYPHVYTAFVYVTDPTRFTDRLVAVRSEIQQ